MPQQKERGLTAYRLVVQAEWVGLDLGTTQRERSVADLIERQFHGRDNAPHLKEQARRALLARIEAMDAAGGIELFLSMQRVSGVPLAASLATFLIPPPDSGTATADRLAETLAGSDRDVTMMDLPAGRSARVRRHSGPAGAPGSMIQELFAPAPTEGWWLLLAFAAPNSPLVPALAKLFDAICATLRWDR